MNGSNVCESKPQQAESTLVDLSLQPGLSTKASSSVPAENNVTT